MTSTINFIIVYYGRQDDLLGTGDTSLNWDGGKTVCIVFKSNSKNGAAECIVYWRVWTPMPKFASGILYLDWLEVKNFPSRIWRLDMFQNNLDSEFRDEGQPKDWLVPIGG